jgi:hypothetical protein
MNDAISPILLDQRIRNGIIEYLEIASSYEEQLEYEANVPIANIPNEMINQWEDWVHGNLRENYREPVYSLDEQAAIAGFQVIWSEVADETPKQMPPLKALLGTPAWEKLRLGAQQALEVFLLRGKFDGDREQFS